MKRIRVAILSIDDPNCREGINQMLRFLDPNQFAGALLLGALFFLAGIILSWLFRRLLGDALRHDQSERIDQITLSFLSHLAVLVIWVLLATFYAHLIPALHRLGTALLTGVSLMSAIVGFAAQATLGNLVAGISLVLYKPFRRGDRLQIQAPAGTEVGEVENISLGYTVLRTDDQRQIIIANGTMAQQTMVKLSCLKLGPNEGADRQPSALEAETGRREDLNRDVASGPSPMTPEDVVGRAST